MGLANLRNMQWILEVVRSMRVEKKTGLGVRQSCVLELTASLEISQSTSVYTSVLNCKWGKTPCLAGERGKLLESVKRSNGFQTGLIIIIALFTK